MINRRDLIVTSSLAAAVWGFGSHTLADEVEEISKLKPGDFTWHPDRSPAGPVAIIVSLPDQLVHVYRNGIRIAVSTCSTGKPGHETPTGVFTILQKDKNHHSSTYDNAPMPNMNRLTWSGVALHAGKLPGYPASHGCVRLPMKFSALLFTVTHIGTPVIIADAHTQPKLVAHPGLVLSEYAEHEFDDAEAGLKGKNVAHPDDAQAVAVSVIVSGADKTITILQNGDTVIAGPATIADPDKPLGSHVLILSHADGEAKGLAWHAIGHQTGGGDAPDPEAGVITRVRAGHDVIAAMKQRMHSGLVFVTTDLPSTPDTKSGKDFVVVNTDDT